jgi:tetratricopeptide (TPR) repeat protein
MSLLNRIFSQFGKRGSGLPERREPDEVLRRWLAADTAPPYAWPDLAAVDARAETVRLMAHGAEAALVEEAVRALPQGPMQAIDRMLRADVWLRNGDYARAESLLTELAQGSDRYAARAALMLGECVYDHGDLPRAAMLAERANGLVPDTISGLILLGNVRAWQGRHDESLALFRRALAHNPDSLLAIGLTAVTLLGQGALREGWQVYARADELVGAYPQAQDCPVWQGEPLGTQRLLIICAYGYGDVMQFLRFVGQLREREPGARLALHIAPPLSRLARQTGWFDIIFEGEPDRAICDWQISTMRLPLALGSGNADVPRHDACLRIAPEDIAEASGWLPPRRPGVKRVGLRWYGRPLHFDAKRSIPFGRLAPLFEVPGIEWVALTEDAQALAGLGEHRLLDASSHLTDFYATGALMHQLDLVISVDTSTVHLAGALGLPVWMLARPDYEWRWGDRGESTPWYRSLRIFRHAPGTFDQDAQVERTAQALREWAAA